MKNLKGELNMSIEQKVTALNNHLEKVGSDRRYWIAGNSIFVCYNATTDADDIDEITEARLKKEYNNFFYGVA